MDGDRLCDASHSSMVQHFAVDEHLVQDTLPGPSACHTALYEHGALPADAGPPHLVTVAAAEMDGPPPAVPVPKWARAKGGAVKWHKYAGKVEWVPSTTLKSMVALVRSRLHAHRWYRFKKSEQYAKRSAGRRPAGGHTDRVRYRCMRCAEITPKDFLRAGIAYQSGRGPSVSIHESHAWGDVDSNHNVFCAPLADAERHELLLRRAMTEAAMAGRHPTCIFDEYRDRLAALPHIADATFAFECVVRSLYRRYTEAVGRAKALPLKWKFTHVIKKRDAAESLRARLNEQTSTEESRAVNPDDFIVIVDQDGMEHTYKASDPAVANYVSMLSAPGQHGAAPLAGGSSTSAAAANGGGDALPAGDTPCDSAVCRAAWRQMQSELNAMRAVVQRMVRRVKFIEDEMDEKTYSLEGD